MIMLTAEIKRLSDEVDVIWRDVRKATSGAFATGESLEIADEALKRLLTMRDTKLVQLRALIAAAKVPRAA